jgi:oxygen-independent coproporphyrinogen-3 oxidase
VDADAEVTVECAPGQLSDASLAAFLAHGVNRLSFGVQSFVDREAAAVGRLHTGATSRDEIRRMQAAGVQRIGIDLIAGLPHQTDASWRYTVEQAIESGVGHVSVYMLEVDDGSRLGREALAGGSRFGAAELPEDDHVADWYAAACEWLGAAGLAQYEISNFGVPSRHNRRYWERRPYVGFGLDAHSMLRAGLGGVRWANAEQMDVYAGPGMGERGFARTVDHVGREAAFEEELFLGLRLVEGVGLARLERDFGLRPDGIGEMSEAGLLQCDGDRLRLTARGRMASNEVFSRLLLGVVV